MERAMWQDRYTKFKRSMDLLKTFQTGRFGSNLTSKKKIRNTMQDVPEE